MKSQNRVWAVEDRFSPSKYLILWRSGIPLHYFLEVTPDSRYLEIDGIGVQPQTFHHSTREWRDSGTLYRSYQVYGEYLDLDQAARELEALQSAHQVMGS